MKQLDKNCYNNFIDKVKEAENCRVLWLTVLETALNDYCHGHDAKRLGHWIGGRDFRLVCHFAGVEPDAVEKIFKKSKEFKLL